MTKKASVFLAGSPAFHPNPTVARHAAALDRRQARLTRDRAQGASPDVIARHELEVVQLTKTVRRSARRVDRLALLRAKAADDAAVKADNAQLMERLDAKQAVEDQATKDLCLVVIDRIQKREADARDRRKLSTPEQRHRASRLRKKLRSNPHVERDAAIQIGRRVVTDPDRLGGFIEVQVNKQLDVLTTEHAAHRIDDVAFAVGRLLQDAWTGHGEGHDRRMETIARLGVLYGSDGEDGPLPSREMGMLRQVFRVRAVAELDAKIAGVVGWFGVRFLKAILVEGHTFKSYAGCTVGGGDRGVGRIGDRFRWLLGAVADALHTATGSEGQLIRATRDPA